MKRCSLRPSWHRAADWHDFRMSNARPLHSIHRSTVYMSGSCLASCHNVRLKKVKGPILGSSSTTAIKRVDNSSSSSVSTLFSSRIITNYLVQSRFNASCSQPGHRHTEQDVREKGRSPAVQLESIPSSLRYTQTWNKLGSKQVLQGMELRGWHRRCIQ